MIRKSAKANSASATDARAILDSIRKIVQVLRVASRAAEKGVGLSGAQLFVLQQLAERSASSLNELAERTATHQSSVSVVVRRLVERGLVSRTASSADKRRIEIDLTPSGRELLTDAPTTITMQLINGLAHMAPDEQTELADLLENWLRASKIDLASPPMIGEFEDQENTGSG